MPSLSLQTAQQPANTRIAIRGIGSAGNAAIEPSVGAFVDGVYIARPGSLLGGLNDVAGIEVLRGPQGTLFGRNASMGALNITTNRPKNEFEAEVEGRLGMYDNRMVKAMVNTPLSDTIAFRVSGIYDEDDGFGRNDLYGGEEFGGFRTLGVRAGLLFELGDNIEWLLRADYQNMKGGGNSGPITVLSDTVTPQNALLFNQRLNGLTPYLDSSYGRHVRQLTGGRLDDDQWGISSEINWFIGDYTLKLISSYRDWDYYQDEQDAMGTQAFLFGREGNFLSETHSQELQLTSPDDMFDGLLSFVAGLYYFHEDYAITENLNLGRDYCQFVVAQAAPALLAGCNAGPLKGAANSDFRQETESLAAYGQATFNITDDLFLTGGIRYSHDDKDGSLVVNVINPGARIVRGANNIPDLEFSGGKVTYRANISYKPVDDVMLFATFATGYKSGGFDSDYGPGAVINRVFNPETTKNYELGVKSQFLDRKITANFTLFETDINDFQLRSYNGTSFSVRNAGSIQQRGVEFELSYHPISGLDLGVNGTRLDSEYTSFANAPNLPGFGGTQDLTGKRAPTSPKWQGVAFVNYNGPLTNSLDWGISTNLSFQSQSDVGASSDSNPQGFQDGYALLGARLSLSDASEKWEAFISAENITDKRYCNLTFPQPLGRVLGTTDATTGNGIIRCNLGTPATVYIGGKVRF